MPLHASSMSRGVVMSTPLAQRFSRAAADPDAAAEVESLKRSLKRRAEHVRRRARRGLEAYLGAMWSPVRFDSDSRNCDQARWFSAPA
jgi:hypothetical protein